MTATVLFLLDAFRADYLDAAVTPFLASCAQNGHHVMRVRPSFGFCERAEILTGRTPEETGYFTAIGYDPEKSPYKNYKSVLALLHFSERIVRYPVYRKALRKFLKFCIRSNPHRMKPYRIPLNLLHLFSLTEDYYDHRDPRAFGRQDLLALMEQRGLTYFYDSFTALNLPQGGKDAERFKVALAAASEKHALYLIFNSVPDSYGHRFGGDSVETKSALSKMDADLQAFVEEFEKHRPGSQYVFLGDHGMLDVQHKIDVEHILQRICISERLVAGKDYSYFLDSTVFRVWLHSDKARESLRQMIELDSELIEYGVFVDKEMCAREHIPHGDRRYGDILWWANPGVLICPDFFHLRSEEVKGMHGYDPRHPQSQGTCIVWGGKQKPMRTPEEPLTKIYTIIKDCVFE